MFTPMTSSTSTCSSHRIEFLQAHSNLREVVLVPNRHWGGDGLLGCVFGYVFIIFMTRTFSQPASIVLPRFGLIHRIPSQSADRKQRNALSVQAELEDREVFVPADASRDIPTTESRPSFERPRQQPVMVHPRPTRFTETSHGGARRSTLTPGSSRGTPPVGRSSGSFLNGDSSPPS